MEFLVSSILLLLIAIGAGKLLSGVLGKKNIKKIKAINAQNPLKRSVFLKKYKEVNMDRLRTTNGLIGCALALGFLLLSAETFRTKERIVVSPKKINPIDEPLQWFDPEVEIVEPEPQEQKELPPPLPEIPLEVEEVEEEVKEPEPIVTPEPLEMPVYTPPSTVTIEPVASPPAPPTPTADVVQPPEPEPPMQPEIGSFAEVMPEFEGGIDRLRKQVAKNYRPPRNFKGKGKVVTRFVVLEDGSIGDIQILKGIEGCDACSEQAIQSIRKVKGRFSPAMQGNKAVKLWFTLPIVVEIK